MRMNSDPEIALVRISPGECIIADLEGERQCRSSRGWRDKCHGGGGVPRSPAMGRWKARGLKAKISEWEQQWRKRQFLQILMRLVTKSEQMRVVEAGDAIRTDAGFATRYQRLPRLDAGFDLF